MILFEFSLLFQCYRFCLILKHSILNCSSLFFQNIFFDQSNLLCYLILIHYSSRARALDQSSRFRQFLSSIQSTLKQSGDIIGINEPAKLNMLQFRFIQFRSLQNIYIMSHTTSILKDVDANLQTKDTSDEDHLWVDKNDMFKIKAHFKGMQVKLLNMFTMAKSELSLVYQKIVGRIKRIQKYLYTEQAKVISSFWALVQDIQQQIQDKTNYMPDNIQNAITNPFLFDQLLSMIPDTCGTENGLNSQRKLNNSSLCSANKLTQMINQTVGDIENIGSNQYKSAVKIKPNEKRIDNLGSLSGKWDALEILNLENKKISRVVPFATLIADSLQQINLSFNEISNINFLNDAYYPILFTLNLKKNVIHSLEGLQFAKFRNLKLLNLSQNKIKKIQCLKQANFPQLIELNLSQNKIQKGDILTDCDFPKLEVLNLDHNQMSNIDFIPNCSFYRLKILSFCFNEIRKIDCLKKCKLQKLQALLGYNNKIESIDFLEKCNFPMLKQIILNNNLIGDISVIEKIEFKHLAQFDLQNNNIQPQQVLCFVTKNDQCKKAKKKFPFIQL